jgi:hypothetical protein
MSIASIGIRVYLEDISGVSSLTGSMNGLGDTVSKLNSKSQESKLALAGFAGMAAGGAIDFKLFSDALGFVVNSASDLEQSMLQVGFSVEGATENSDAMRNKLMELDNASIYSSTDIGNAFSAIGQHAYNATDIMQYMGAAAVNLAENMRGSPVDAANILGDAMDMWGAKASQANDFANDLAYAMHHGIPDTNEMSQALQAAGAQAFQSGLSFRDFTIALDILGRAGYAGSQAGTALRYMLGALTSPTEKATMELANLGVITVNNVTPAFQDFQDQLQAVAGVNVSTTFDGTLRSLKGMYDSALAVGTLHTDQTFYEWAVSTGILKSGLFDATGNFRGMEGILDTLVPKIMNLKTEQEKLAALGDLMGVRGGKALQTFSADQGKDILAYFKALGEGAKAYEDHNQVAQDAAATTRTFAGALDQVKSTITSVAAQAGGPLVQTLTNMMNSFNDWFGGVRAGNPELGKTLMVILAVGTALSALAVVVGVIGAAFILLSGPALVFVGVAAGVAAGIALISVGIGLLVTRVPGVSQAFGNIGKVFQDIGSFIGRVFGPSFRDIGQQFTTIFKIASASMIPMGAFFRSTFTQISTSIQPVLPTLRALGAVILAVLGGVVMGTFRALGSVAGVIFGSVGKLFQSLITTLAGVVQFLIGFLAVIGTIIKFFIDLFTKGPAVAFQNFGKNISAAFNLMIAGIVTTVTGLAKTIITLITALFASILLFVGGFINGFINFFKHLWDVLVGHSIIPDMITAIIMWILKLPGVVLGYIASFISMAIAWFARMPGQVLAFLSGLGGIIGGVFGGLAGFAMGGINGLISLVATIPGRISGFLSGLPGMAGGWAASMMNMFTSTITNMVGNVQNAASSVVNGIKSFLGFASPPKDGPMRDSDRYMPNMMRMFATGITDNSHLVTNSAQNIALGLKGHLLATPSVGRLQAQSYQQQQMANVTFNLDSKPVAQATVNLITGEAKMNGLNRAWR